MGEKMQNETTAPVLRFEGFTDAWEQRKFGELFEEYSEKDRADLPPLTIIQGGGTVYRDESNRNLQFDKSSLSNYKAVNPDDFIVHLRSFEGGLEKATCCGLISPAYHTFRGNSIDSDFYYLYFRSKRFIDTDLKPHVYGIRDGRSIDIDGMKTIPIPWTNVDEQRAIGGFFKDLDSLITLHQRKCERLKRLKAAMLDKMFPKPGEKYPALRFEGFTDAWEQRKLGELIQLGGSGGTPSATNPAYYGGDIPFLSIADIDGRDIANTAKTLTDEGLQNSAAWIVPAGAVSLAMYASVGKVGIIRQNTATSQAFYNMTFEDEALRDFVFTRLEKAEANSEWEPYISTGTQRNLNADKVRSFSLEVPSIEEASEISAYFANLDHLITLHQRKCERLKRLKAAMLDKMFV